MIANKTVSLVYYTFFGHGFNMKDVCYQVNNGDCQEFVKQSVNEFL